MDYKIIQKETTQKANKEYNCDMCLWITESEFLNEMNDYDVSFTDKRWLVQLRKDKYAILKGDNYMKQYVQDEYSGSKYWLRGRVDVIEFCRKYELFID